MLIDGTDRLVNERLCRQYLQRIFQSAMADRFDAVFDIFNEARSHGEWMQVAVWSGLPNTLKERIRDHETRRTD